MKSFPQFIDIFMVLSSVKSINLLFVIKTGREFDCFIKGILQKNPKPISISLLYILQKLFFICSNNSLFILFFD